MADSLAIDLVRPGRARAAAPLRSAPAIEAIGTAVPQHRVAQSEIKRRAGDLLGRIDPGLLKYLTVFDNAGIDWRHLAKDPDWYLDAHGWRDRSTAFVEEGLALLETGVADALEKAGRRRGDIDGIVLVTSTGIATPSLDARLSTRLGLRPDVTRVPIWGLGCAGGVAGLARGADLARAHPDKTFLVAAVELCSLAFMRTSLDKKMLVAATLFSDGAACALVSGSDAAPKDATRVSASASHLWPDTEWVMGWDVLDEGLGVVFSNQIPDIVREKAAPVVKAFLAENEVATPAYALHPGGAKVIRAYQEALGLSSEDLADTVAVLRGYGNMSSPTALFVLERMLRRGLGADRPALVGALGPGFASELALVRASG